MSGGLAIFVKSPSLSPVKTRLGKDVGRLRAEAFHLSSAEAVASVAQQYPDPLQLTAYWAVAEARALRLSAWSDLPRLAQGEGGLGERMARVYRLLLGRHDCALLVGADAPQLTVELLRQAVEWLSQSGPRLVIGPAQDGGFWLFGGNCPLPCHAWKQVAYSRPDTLRQFVAAMQASGQWLELDVLADVDRGCDLATVREQLQQLATPTAAQQRLTKWLEDCASAGGALP
jgi:rSAM/selenodomain-associated transferase 1